MRHSDAIAAIESALDGKTDLTLVNLSDVSTRDVFYGNGPGALAPLPAGRYALVTLTIAVRAP